jgi:hypothetical protein
MYRLFFVSICLALSAFCSAQSSTFITAEIGWSDDHYSMTDPGGRFERPSLGAGLYGIAVRHMLTPHFFIESGIYTREYHQGIAIRKGYSVGGSGRRVAQLPMRVGANLGVFNNRILIRPYGGLALNITGERDEENVESAFTYEDNSVLAYKYKILYQTQVFFLAQAGLALDIRLGKRTYIGASSSWNWGLQKIQLQHISYTVDGGPVVSAVSSTRGGYQSIVASFSYRFGK